MRRLLPSLPLLLSTLFLLAPRPVGADEIRLHGGTSLEGVVLERNEKEVRLLLPEGVELTLAAGDVAEVVTDEAAPRANEYIRY
ncbi:MAG: hypothetical protein ACYTG6_05090, partial [Planctomycetota bacterium]